MLKVNDTVLYGTTGVCTVDSIEDKKIGKVTRKYYVLKPMAQSSSTVFLPADNEQLLGKVREIVSADEIKNIVSEMSDEPDIWIEDDGERKQEFSDIVSSGDRKKCLVLIRTLHSRQKALAEKGRRLHLADERIFKEAERLINDEFSYVLGIAPDEVRMFIKSIEKVK